MPHKKINLKLVGLDGNAFALMGAFSKQAKREGWTDREIGEVLQKAKSGGYDNLVSTIADHCADPAGGDDGDEDNDSQADGDDEPRVHLRDDSED